MSAGLINDKGSAATTRCGCYAARRSTRPRITEKCATPLGMRFASTSLAVKTIRSDPRLAAW